ncbi:hypothetical protein JAAARDRAFT_40533 [Jaapia argillacea MUCL 33604]|uniref:Uncharacterized protein n=1 Tax=Jaapia argillacea MUCL 33604 TaxID=933084 RepID=A0A067PM39_9AGAM|nr:hypothetical protein JAAARDRAFT_40533 [Jaapia argillacea MUCL 33604]
MSGSIKILDSGELEIALANLRGLLSGLLSTLSENVYNVENYTVNKVEEEDKGCVGALNHDFEHIFCPQGRVHGPIELKGHGKGLVADVDILSAALADFPRDAVLQKWVSDLTAGAEHAEAVYVNPGLSQRCRSRSHHGRRRRV